MTQLFGRRGFGVFKDSEDWVRVRYPDGRELDIVKDLYVASKRAPPFEALPLREATHDASAPAGAPLRQFAAAAGGAG
jgi:hypothetical protein